MSVWSTLMRAIDWLFGEQPPLEPSVDREKVEAAIRVIQTRIDAARQDNPVKPVRVSDLSPTDQERLTAELATLLAEQKASKSVLD